MSIEIFYHAIKNEIKSHFNATVASVHFALIQNGFKCVALGEQPPGKLDARLSDLLPASWNENTYKCSLVYWNPLLEFHLLVKVFHMKDFALVHLLKEQGVSIKDMDIKYSEFFGDDFSTYESLFKRPNTLMDAIDIQLVKPCITPLKKDVIAPQIAGIIATQEKEMISPPTRSTNVYLPCGRCDIDPFCPCAGGGMIFDPLRNVVHPPPPPFLLPRPHPSYPPDNDPNRIPFGSVPPGARFDPIGPNSQDPRRTWEPDPDDMKKPTFNDRFNL